jgi:regulator of sigma E protease
MLMTVLSFIIVLGILVFFHELGHYLVARRSGIVVEEFGMGYPPRLVKLFTYDGTDFTLNLLPFGGFARMKGEDAGDMSSGSFNAASRGGRAATLLAGPAMNAVLAVLLFGASFMAGFPAVAGYPQLTSIDPDSTAADLEMLPGDIILSINGKQPLVNAAPKLQYDILRRGSDGSEPDGLVVYSRAGKIVEIPFSGEERASGLLGSSEYLPVLTTQINMTAPDSPAERSGIESGDIVYAIDDIVITYDNPLNKVVTERAGQEIAMTVLRDGAWETVAVTPRAEPPPGEGALGVQISPITTLGTLPILPALWLGFRRVITIRV